MDVVTKNQKLAQFFFALGHGRRLRIVATLSSAPQGMTFEAIEAATDIKGSSLTHHMRILKDAGLVVRKVVGRNSVYRFNKTPLQRHLGGVDIAALSSGLPLSSRSKSPA